MTDRSPKPAPAAERNPRWATLVDQQANFYRVTERLYRSEQPLKTSVLPLRDLGVHIVISFRAFHSDEKVLRDSGIALKRIPMHTWHIANEDVVQALRDIHQAEQAGPVLIHCQHGADRTGLVAAMYRMIYQDWTREEALDELQNGGYGFHSMWRNIPRYLHRVDLASIRAQLQPTG